ncbi:Sec-independent protein translocase subunit TatA [Streptomyces sp. NPDC051217]|uniref:Sec-independent protein translocase subunit TatA n=1 Tax=Streptomyces sp. NPDC051217 TaxID=3365644 RepID=UPI00378DE920
MFGISEIAIILIVVILIFGAKKLPDLARSAGKSARILKSEAKAMKSDQAQPPAAGHVSFEEGSPPRVIPGEVSNPRPTPSPGSDVPRP